MDRTPLVPRQNLDNFRAAAEIDSREEDKLGICRELRADLVTASSGVRRTGTGLSVVRLGPALFLEASSPVFELSLLFFCIFSILKSAI